MENRYKIRNLDYVSKEVSKLMQKAKRGSITQEALGLGLQHWGNKLLEKELVYSPDEVLNLRGCGPL